MRSLIAGARLVFLLGVFAGVGDVLAQSAPDYGFDWVTVGAPGNRGATPEELPFDTLGSLHGAGAVDYSYRIMRTKVSNTQWLGFVEAYAPFWNQDFDPLSTLGQIHLTGSGVSNVGGSYSITPGRAGWAANPTFLVVARFANWLHNGQANEAWAFESGAYDMSSVVIDSDGRVVSDSLQRSEDARFWIPNIDEYVKAAYYDPNRYGQGKEGYWIYPDQGNEALIVGLPGVGETLGDISDPFRVDLMSYSDVRSYFGLLDVSGHYQDFTETRTDPFEPGNFSRWVMGSTGGDASFALWDRIDLNSARDPWSFGGVRLASVVPAPSALCVSGVFGLILQPHIRRRSRC